MPPKPNALQRLVQLLPSRWRRATRTTLERSALTLVSRREADCSYLRLASALDPHALMLDDALSAAWRLAAVRLDALGIPALRGGLPPFDRRAIYQLVLGLEPTNVLEVGTHLGASTTAIAAALARAGRRGQLTTVDRVDVNDPRSRHWARHDSPAAPRELVARLGPAEAVEFVVADSLQYLDATDRRFDLVFLDGDHAAATVYREIPAALAALAPGGAVLLHDFFPAGTTYGEHGSEIPGPRLAVERLQAEGTRFATHPLGPLPWPTDLPDRMTSLALLLALS